MSDFSEDLDRACRTVDELIGAFVGHTSQLYNDAAMNDAPQERENLENLARASEATVEKLRHVRRMLTRRRSGGRPRTRES